MSISLSLSASTCVIVFSEIEVGPSNVNLSALVVSPSVGSILSSISLLSSLVNYS